MTQPAFGLVTRPARPALHGAASAPEPSVAALMQEAECAERLGRWSEARVLYEWALRRISHRPATSGDAQHAPTVLRLIARAYLADDDVEAALDCLDAALAVAHACGDAVNVGYATNLRGGIHLQRGQLDEAEELYQHARMIADRCGDQRLVALTAHNLGIIENIRGDLNGALAHYETSAAAYRALGLQQDLCGILNNLGMLYTDLERWDEAERAYQEAVTLSDDLEALPVRTMVQVNRTEMWVARGEFGRAREAGEAAMALARERRDPHAQAEVYKFFGIIEREQGCFGPAEACFREAERLAAERQDLLLLAEIAREQASLYQRLGRNREALQSLARADQLFGQLRATQELEDLGQREAALQREFLNFAQRWGEAVEAKDLRTQGHCERVARLSCAIAERAGMDRRSLFWFEIAALLHDVGKIRVPAEVLNKPGKLSAIEWALMRAHPEVGVELLVGIEFPWDVIPVVRSHHERWDGRGYPHGLEGDAIPYSARILTLADVYDALTSERSYKPALTREEALAIMRLDVGGQFDPALFEHFEAVMSAWPQAPAATRATGATAVAALLAASHRSDEIANLDETTNLVRRKAFAEIATGHLACCGPERPIALLVLDVDRFKQINDTCGHLCGDQVLRMVANLLRQHAPPGALVGRYAGDEFVILLPDGTPDHAVQVAESIRRAVEAKPIVPAHHDERVAVTLSIGVAFAPRDGERLEPLFATADRALYSAKRRGRNAVGVSGAEPEGAPPALGIERFVA